MHSFAVELERANIARRVNGDSSRRGELLVEQLFSLYGISLVHGKRLIVCFMIRAELRLFFFCLFMVRRSDEEANPRPKEARRNEKSLPR